VSEIDAVTVQAFARMHGKQPKTVRLWIAEGKVAAEKDPGGHCWLVFVKKRRPKTPEDSQTCPKMALPDHGDL